MTKILLVEDDKSLREIYGVRLLAEGYEIASAGDGEEALAMAVKERPDLIISDVMMPKISGFDMLDILRSTPETKEIKIIMMTALSSEDQRARGVALGANRYLVKSQVGIEDVVRTVHEVLADSPVATVSAAQAFHAPTPSAPVTSQPQITPAPTTLINPVPAPQPPTPQSIPVNSITPDTTVTPPILQQQPLTQPQPPIAPVSSTQTMETMETMASTAPQPATAIPTPEPATTVQLPQPTAPFSSQSPMSFSSRNINPAQPAPGPDMATLMSQELNDGTTTTPPSMPETPTQSTIPPSSIPEAPTQPTTPPSNSQVL